MNSNKMKKVNTILFVVLIIFTITSCNNKKKKVDESKKVTMLYGNWVGGIALSHLAKVALEQDSFEVELISLELGLIYGELAKDNPKGDLFTDAWLPNTQKPYWDEYGHNLVVLGKVFEDGTTGLIVPSYVPINSIEELNAHRDKFDGKIIGIGSGAGIHMNTIKAIEEYNLDFEQITSSGPAMVASIEKAVRDQEWVVVTGWKPHYKWAVYDLKYLEDPKGIYPTDFVGTIARKGFEEEKPDAARFFRNMKLNEEQLYSLFASVDKYGEMDGARKWYYENKKLVDSWKTKTSDSHE